MVVPSQRMHVLSLCSGAGGLDLGLKIALPESRCICFVEGEAYAADLLVGRMEKGMLYEAPIYSDVRTFDGKPWRGLVHCITAGYPCQPFSLAGKRQGTDDPRHLWPHIARIIREVQPQRCFFENVVGHLSLGFETVVNDLQAMGYRVAAGLFTAEEVGSSHQRERLFILADSQNPEWGQRCCGGIDVEELDDGLQPAGKEGSGRPELSSEEVDSVWPPRPDELDRWKRARHDLKPSLCGMADGLAHRMDRIHVLGNGVVQFGSGHAWTVLEASFLEN
jgi:DNA (cytosine-5)-methyltransferase 1